jgi:cell division protein DivIC
VPEGKRSEPKRRSPGSRPAKAGDPARGRSRASQRREPRPSEPRAEQEPVTESITASIAAAAEHQTEQRLGSAARRAAILAAVVCVLTLTIAGPVRTYFAQRTEMQQLAASEAALRAKIANLEQQKAKLADPVFIAAQARERLGFVMPGDIPYQVQLPPGAAAPPQQPGAAAQESTRNDPWYTSLWRTIAETPHNVPSSAPAAPPANPPAPGPPPGG